MPRIITLFSALLVALAAAPLELVAGVTTCNVLDYGGAADNATDVGPAILKAYAECISTAPATTDPADRVLLVPSGNFLINSNVQINKASYMTLSVVGDLFLKYNKSLAGNMIMFYKSDNIVMNGGGTFYGNGLRFRPGGDISSSTRPRLVRFDSCNNIDYSNVNLYDAPMFHLTVIGDNNVVHDFEVHATNIGTTDGVDISGNNNYVHDVLVEGGDECVTAKSPTDGLLVENIVCINTDGTQVGSFGSDAVGYSVQNVHYRNVSLTGASNGVCLKSYATAAGTIRNLTYEDYTVTDVAYPIRLAPALYGGGTPAVQAWSDIHFINWKGTGTPSRANVTLDCFSNAACENITFENVAFTGTKPPVVKNACGTSTGTDIDVLQACSSSKRSARASRKHKSKPRRDP